MAEKLSHRIYNISGEKPITYAAFAEVVKQIVPKTEVNLPPGHGPRYRVNAYMDISRLEQDVGYRPQYTIERAVAEYIDWLRRYPE
jgi:UDP-glucose 4-epimerase